MKYFSIFTISLILHFLLGFAAVYLGETSQFKTSQPIEILTTESKSKSLIEKQIVREADAPKREKPNYDLKPRFFSDTTKYTDQETRAANSGLTQNKGSLSRKSGFNSSSQAQLSKNGDNPSPSPRPLPLPTPSAGGGFPTPGTSTVGETLPEDIKIGSWTSLNTERYLFYTFFARIEERVRFHWERGVRNAAEFIPPKKLLGHEWTTELEVVLNSKGDFEQVILHKRSGIDSFDQAAVNAFRIGSPYINPPQELVQNDNKLHLKYQITVFYAPPNARL